MYVCACVCVCARCSWYARNGEKRDRLQLITEFVSNFAYSSFTVLFFSSSESMMLEECFGVMH